MERDDAVAEKAQESPEYEPAWKKVSEDLVSALDWHEGEATIPGSDVRLKLLDSGEVEVSSVVSVNGKRCKCSTKTGQGYMASTKVSLLKMEQEQRRAALEWEETVCKSLWTPSGDADSEPSMSKQAMQENLTPEQANRLRQLWHEEIGDAGSFDDSLPLTSPSCAVLCCAACGRYGTLQTFLDWQLCSASCAVALVRDVMRQQREITKQCRQEATIDTLFTGSGPVVKRESLDSSLSEELQQPEQSAGDSESFSWEAYLPKCHGNAAPNECFVEPNPPPPNLFKKGMHLEVADPRNPSCICSAVVLDVLGCRVRVRLSDGGTRADAGKGHSEHWLASDSYDLHPVGFCQENDIALNGAVAAFAKKGSAVAPVEAFRQQQPTNHGFKVGMALEGICSGYCRDGMWAVAQVVAVKGHRFLIHFDGTRTSYDRWCYENCSWIRPAGVTASRCHEFLYLEDPKSEQPFDWQSYIDKNGLVLAPPELFKEPRPNLFKRFMHLEALDRTYPQHIAVATVAGTFEHRVQIRFDDQIDRPSFWCDSDSVDIHPPGWCAAAEHPLLFGVSEVKGSGKLYSNLAPQRMRRERRRMLSTEPILLEHSVSGKYTDILRRLPSSDLPLPFAKKFKSM